MRDRIVRYTGYSKCPLPTVPAGEIETAVIQQIRALLRHPEVIARTYQEVRKHGSAGPDEAAQGQLNDLRDRHEQTQKSIRALLSAGGQDEGFMAKELRHLNGELKALERSIRELEAKPGHPGEAGQVELDRVSEAMQAIDPVWDLLFIEEQQRIIQLLVEQISVTTHGIDIRFRTNGIEQIVEEIQPEEAAARA